MKKVKGFHGCISNCRRLVETPTGAARRGRCLHRPQSTSTCDNLKCTRFHFLLLALLMTVCNTTFAQNPINWTKNELMEPAALAAKLKSSENIPVIISVGPGALIPNSIDIGMTTEKKNLEKFKKEIGKLPTDTAIVIYCGCCPFEHCPNVRPAIDALKKMKYTNFHLLNLPANIKTDWISRGYPVVD